MEAESQAARKAARGVNTEQRRTARARTARAGDGSRAVRKQPDDYGIRRCRGAGSAGTRDGGEHSLEPGTIGECFVRWRT